MTTFRDNGKTMKNQLSIEEIETMLAKVNELRPMRNAIQLIKRPSYVAIRLGFLPFMLKEATDICAPLLDLFPENKGESIESPGPYSNSKTVSVRSTLKDGRTLGVCYHIDQS